jgi:hypothetical protein
MSKFNLLPVDSLCVDSVVSRGLFTNKNILSFGSGINRLFVPTKAALINNLSPVQIANNLSVNLNLSHVSTAPIRAITKYLNNLLLITRRK